MILPIDRSRLARLLEMLGSNFDAEVLTAARIVHQQVRGAGLTWEQILGPPPKPQTHRDDCGTVRPCGSPIEQAHWALHLYAAKAVSLSMFELNILEQVSRSEVHFDPRKYDIFDRLIERIGQRAGEPAP